MCDIERKKRCEGCKKVLSIDSFNTHKVRRGDKVPNLYCKKCQYARDSKKAFKKKRVVDAYVNTIMFNITGKDY